MAESMMGNDSWSDGDSHSAPTGRKWWEKATGTTDAERRRKALAQALISTGAVAGPGNAGVTTAPKRPTAKPVTPPKAVTPVKPVAGKPLPPVGAGKPTPIKQPPPNAPRPKPTPVTGTGPGSLGPVTTPVFAGGGELPRDDGWSDGGDFEQRWGEWGGGLAGMGVMLADGVTGLKEWAGEQSWGSDAAQQVQSWDTQFSNTLHETFGAGTGGGGW